MRESDLILRVSDLILRSPPQAGISQGPHPEEARSAVSKDEATEIKILRSPMRVAATAVSSTSSSRRTPGPIRRVACFRRCCSTAFAQRLRPVVMGPGVRRDDGYE